MLQRASILIVKFNKQSMFLGFWEWELESNGEPVYDGEEELTFSGQYDRNKA